MKFLPLSALSALAVGAAAAEADAPAWPIQTYKSSSAQPPSLKITKAGPTSDGYLFFDQNGPNATTYGLFIMSDDNELIWQSPAIGDYSAYRAQVLDGKPVITYFNGVTLPEPYGFGYGIIQILDDTYTSIYNVSLPKSEGIQPVNASGPDFDPSGVESFCDMHEARITRDNTMLVTAYNTTQLDLSSIGGPKDGWVVDGLFYEVDIKTNKVLHQWSALDHLDQIPLSATAEVNPIEDLGRNSSYPYGYFHINSVDKFEDGSYLVSSRFYCSIYHVAKDGNVEWTLQGRTGGDFELDDGLQFCYQHDAVILSEAEGSLEMSFFDNNNDATFNGVNQTAGYVLHLDTKAHKANVLRKLVDPKDTVYAHSQGATEVLGDGHVIVGYGSTPKIKEYDAQGNVVMTAEFGEKDGTIFSYRSHRLPWVGRPAAPPDVYACTDAKTDETKLYMSWNGATEHQSWHINAGPEENSLKTMKQVERTGFETVATVPGQVSFVSVQAAGPGIMSAWSSAQAVQEKC